MPYTRADLMEMDKLFKQSAREAPDAASVPEGVYQARIKKAEVTQTSGGIMKVHFVYEIAGGKQDLVGAPVESWEGLRDARNMAFFRKKMDRLRLKFKTFMEVPELLLQAVGAVVEIQVKHKDDYVNVYVNKLIEKGSGKFDDGKTRSEETEEETEEETTEASAEEVDENEEETEDADTEETTEEESEDESEAPAAPRRFPTQEQIGSLKPVALAKLLKELKVKGPFDDDDERRAIAQVFVCAYEDDFDSDFELEHVNAALAAIGQKPSKDIHKAWAAIIAFLSE